MPDRIRILFVIGSMDAGGSERQVLNILRHLDRNRFEPFLFLVSRTGDFLDGIPDDVEIESFSDQPPLKGINYPGRIRRAQIQHLASTLRSLDIGVVYDRTPHMTLLAGPACLHAGVARLSTIVADPARDLQQNFPRFRILKERLLRKAYRTADRVIVNSEALSEPCQEFYNISPDRVVTVVNGFDFAEITTSASAQSVEENEEIKDGEFQIVTVGRLHPQKGLPDLIKAVHSIRNQPGYSNVRLSIVGRGPDEAILRQLVGELDLMETVEFAGFLENPYEMVASADLFCLTSHYEGMPNVLVEAMALGTPVLATDCPYGPKEILNGGELGVLVSVGDVDAIVRGIAANIDEKSVARARAQSAVASVKARFGVEKATRQLEKVILEVLQ